MTPTERRGMWFGLLGVMTFAVTLTITLTVTLTIA